MKYVKLSYSFMGLTRRHAEASLVVQHGEEGRVQTGDRSVVEQHSYFAWHLHWHCHLGSKLEHELITAAGVSAVEMFSLC